MRLFLAVVLLWAEFVFGQQQRPLSDPTALSYAAQSVAAMTSNGIVTDVTLTGSVNTWMVGSTADSGTVTLKISGYGESRIDLHLAANGTWSVIRDASTGIQRGEWISHGAGTLYTQTNCMTDAAWFYPLNSSMAVAPGNGIVLSYIGLETLGGSQVQHLQSYNYQPNLDPDSQAQLQSTSTIDYYLDAITFLPLAEHFNSFADSNSNIVIPIQVLFLNYKRLGGVNAPQEIQEYINGTLLFDATINSVSVNTGIPLSVFTVPQ
jgi:hypothetical protein